MQIEKFIFNYLDSLIRIKRIAKGVAPEVDKTICVGAQKSKLLLDLGLTQDQADSAASKVQALVRGHMARKNIKNLIERRDSQRLTRPDVSYITYKLLKKYNLTSAQANTICTKIQAAFRGWKVRRAPLCSVPSHESWRHDWLWKEFQMSPSEVKAVTRAEKKSHSRGEELLFQPRRSIDIDHIKFMKAFKGELADYDDKSEASSIGDTSPSDESEGKPTELEEDKSIAEEPEAIKKIKEQMEKEHMEEETPEELKEVLEESQIAISTLHSTDLSEEHLSKPEVIERLEEEKSSRAMDEVESEGRELFNEFEIQSEENAPEEEEFVMGEYEPSFEEEQEMAAENVENTEPEEGESYSENNVVENNVEEEELAQEESIEEE